MNKKILTVIILVLALCLAFAFTKPVMAENNDEQAYKDVTIECITEPEGLCCKGKNGEDCCEYTCKVDYGEYECAGCCYSVDGNVIKLTNDIAGIKVTGGDYTIDLNGHSIKSVKKFLKPVVIEGGNVKIINSLNSGAIETGTAVSGGNGLRIYY